MPLPTDWDHVCWSQSDWETRQLQACQRRSGPEECRTPRLQKIFQFPQLNKPNSITSEEQISPAAFIRFLLFGLLEEEEFLTGHIMFCSQFFRHHNYDWPDIQNEREFHTGSMWVYAGFGMQGLEVKAGELLGFYPLSLLHLPVACIFDPKPEGKCHHSFSWTHSLRGRITLLQGLRSKTKAIFIS